ncbi:Rna polymerase ii subunit b1 ctd phosphatase rpap2-like protein [Thalictrum thalictroides]|uniref:Rna polymerase ii subunit b1 ctd phosphatase rpap2-like protein n=1 Tax=Thalictrum thalictroides TaxID=46969 RepID=A0A7J6VIE8_THATH|nr:Rna polymerase ii subunit b1 ctd phosphatase rpap2-like protein [Thalictrum thalictroides]
MYFSNIELGALLSSRFKSKSTRPKADKTRLVNDLDFTTTIILGDPLITPQLSSSDSDPKLKDYMLKLEEMEINEFNHLKMSSGLVQSGFQLKELNEAMTEACALALSQAAEAVASGEVDVTNVVSEAGIMISPQLHEADNYSHKDENMTETDLVLLKWPKNPGVLNSEIFGLEDSWYEPPPEDFSFNLSSFATMYMALFGWTTSSSLAYIYGQDENSHEEFSLVNGREYPYKIVLSDGRSSEIKLAMAGCLGRALPEVATDLRLKTLISTIEKEVGRLLNTMSFVDALPPFKLKQWLVIAILFIDALSVCRASGVAANMRSLRIQLQKVFDDAQVSGEEKKTVYKNVNATLLVSFCCVMSVCKAGPSRASTSAAACPSRARSSAASWVEAIVLSDDE